MGLIEFAKKLWADGEAGETPILAAELNRLEDAIDGINETAMTVPVGQSDAGLVFMQNVRFESRIRAGVAGDSTGNNANEWFDLLAATLASEHIDQRYSIPHWNDPTQTWDAATVIQEGTTPTSGVKARDTFDGMSGDLTGRTPTLGGSVWSNDGSNGVGDWTGDGSDAIASTETVRGGQLLDMGVSGEMETRIDFTISTATVASARSMRFYTGYKSAADNVFGAITVSQSAGAALLSIYKRIGNVSTKISAATDVTSTAIAANTADQAVTVRVRREGLGVTFTVTKGGVTDTITAALTAEEASTLSAASKGGIAIVQAAPLPVRMTLFELTLLNAPAAPDAVFYNTSVSGTRLEYQQARLPLLFPERLDVLFLSAGHNYQQQTPAELHAAIDSFVADFRALWPGTPIILTGQNPEFAPATARLAHNTRQQSLPAYAKTRGFGYIPVTTAFLAQPNKGRALVLDDGIHPTVGAVEDTGSALWRDTVHAYLSSL